MVTFLLPKIKQALPNLIVKSKKRKPGMNFPGRNIVMITKLAGGHNIPLRGILFYPCLILRSTDILAGFDCTGVYPRRGQTP